MPDPTPSWLLLVLSLPTSRASGRVRIWRSLKAAGCAALRDGAYLLPARPAQADALQALAAQCVEEGGAAWVVSAQPRSDADAMAWRRLFDRSTDYAVLRREWKQQRARLSGLSKAELGRLQRRLQREYDALRVIDFFPSEASQEAEAAWREFSQRVESLMTPGEPKARKGGIARLNPADFRGRVWATRRHLWVDRVASAWLIRRFIDPDARFRWLARPSDCPKSALGFDFDGARFTHLGDRVSFETLLASFGLENDAGLRRLAAMVHHLDVGGDPVPEAAGFEAVLAGARARLPDDDALLDEIGQVLDSLYIHFTKEPAA